MYPVSDKYKNYSAASARSYDLLIRIGKPVNGVYEDFTSCTSKDGILKLKIVIGQTSGGFTIGKTICASLDLLLGNDIKITEKSRLKIYIRFNVSSDYTEQHCLGWFYVDSIAKSPYNQRVIAFDKMMRLSKNFKSELNYPARVSDIVNEISRQTNIPLDPELNVFNDAYIAKSPVKGYDDNGAAVYYTRREVLGYCAGINGGNAYVDARFNICFSVPKAADSTIKADSVVSQLAEDTNFKIDNIVVNTTGNSGSLEDDYGENTVEIFNPLEFSSTDVTLAVLKDNLEGLSYDSVTIKKQGTGIYQLGDLIKYEDVYGKIYDMLIMGIVYDFSNGFFSETLYSLAKTEAQRQYAGKQNISSGKTASGEMSSDTLIATGYQAGAKLKFSGNSLSAYDKSGQYAGGINGFGGGNLTVQTPDFQVMASDYLIQIGRKSDGLRLEASNGGTFGVSFGKNSYPPIKIVSANRANGASTIEFGGHQIVANFDGNWYFDGKMVIFNKEV